MDSHERAGFRDPKSIGQVAVLAKRDLYSRANRVFFKRDEILTARSEICRQMLHAVLCCLRQKRERYDVPRQIFRLHLTLIKQSRG